MTSDDKREAAEIERRLREAAVQAHPDYWPLIGDLAKLFNAERDDDKDVRSTVNQWLKNGVRFGARRFHIRYKDAGGGYRRSHPADVVMILDEMRKVRTADHPDGVPEPAPGACPTCGQSLPV